MHQIPEGKSWRDKYKSAFEKNTETGHAGHYSVQLKDHGIQAELTTTPRVGIHRYRLETPDTVTLVIDLEHRDELIHYSIEPRPDNMIVGHRVSKNWAEEQHVYFAMKFDCPFQWGDQLREITRIDTWKMEAPFKMTMVPVFAADFGMIEELNLIC